MIRVRQRQGTAVTAPRERHEAARRCRGRAGPPPPCRASLRSRCGEMLGSAVEASAAAIDPYTAEDWAKSGCATPLVWIRPAVAATCRCLIRRRSLVRVQDRPLTG